MKVGDLVEITRTGIGVPAGTIGLITEKHNSSTGHGYVYSVHIIGKQNKKRVRRYLDRDMRVIK